MQCRFELSGLKIMGHVRHSMDNSWTFHGDILDIPLICSYIWQSLALEAPANMSSPAEHGRAVHVPTVGSSSRAFKRRRCQTSPVFRRGAMPSEVQKPGVGVRLSRNGVVACVTWLRRTWGQAGHATGVQPPPCGPCSPAFQDLLPVGGIQRG